MTSARLRRAIEQELVRLHAAGRGELVRAFLALDHGGDFARLERYLEGCRALERRAREQGAEEVALVLRYFVGRTLAYPLDRPREALPELVDLLAEVAAGSRRGGCLQALTELELLRAWHKIDAPGFRDEIVAGARSLWPRLGDDLGPQTELLDVFWRTGYWCRDPELMRAATRLAQGVTRTLPFSAAYWRARELTLEDDHPGAVVLLQDLLGSRGPLDENGDLWRHYLLVELAANETAIGFPESARATLAKVAAELGPIRDPMLRWDFARASAAAAREIGDDEAEVAAWRDALDAVEGLGTDRIACEFAVALAEAGARCGDSAALARARAVLDATLPRLRSAADLREAARKVPDLYS